MKKYYLILFIIGLFLFKNEIKNVYLKRNLIFEKDIDSSHKLKKYRPFNFGINGEITSYYIEGKESIFLCTCDEKERINVINIDSKTIQFSKLSRRNMFGNGEMLIENKVINID